MKLFRTKIFKKDYQKLKMTDTQYTKYVKFLSTLLDGKPLPLEARDHNLIGDYSGFKEFHIGGDLLVIYCIEDDILRLTRIGTVRAILPIRVSLDQRNLCLKIINGLRIFSLQSTKKSPNPLKAWMECVFLIFS
jgi:mRNA interferase YafQ